MLLKSTEPHEETYQHFDGNIGCLLFLNERIEVVTFSKNSELAHMIMCNKSSHQNRQSLLHLHN